MTDAVIEAPQYGSLIYVPNEAPLWGVVLIGVASAMRVCDELDRDPVGTLTLSAEGTDILGRPMAPEGMYVLGWAFQCGSTPTSTPSGPSMFGPEGVAGPVP